MSMFLNLYLQKTTYPKYCDICGKFLTVVIDEPELRYDLNTGESIYTSQYRATCPTGLSGHVDIISEYIRLDMK